MPERKYMTFRKNVKTTKTKKGRERGRYEDYWNPQTHLIKLFVGLEISLIVCSTSSVFRGLSTLCRIKQSENHIRIIVC